MGIFDQIGSVFGPNIAGPLTSGLQQGYNLAYPQLTAGLTNIGGLISGQALPFLQTQAQQAFPFLENVYQTGQQGVSQLENLLGLGGPGGMKTALNTLQQTPGYQFTKTQGQDALNAAAAASGQLGSGNQIKSLADYTSGLASQTYQNAVGNLAPLTNMFTTGAQNIANVFGGLGTGGANLLQNQAGLQSPFYTNLANLGWGFGTGTGQAGAAQNAINANLGLGAITGLGNLAAGIFSDARLKQEIEPVGELYDGSNIYKFVYKHDPLRTPRIGLMAQEVERTTPEAVRQHPSGYKMVNYDLATGRAAQLARLAGLAEAA